MVDVVFVEDNRGITKLISSYCDIYELSYKIFNETNSLIKFLEGAGDKPKFYLVDMRLEEGLVIPDNDGPEKLFFHLKSNGLLTDFIYMSAHFSEHDKEVINRTNANFMLKKELMGYLAIIKEKLK